MDGWLQIYDPVRIELVDDITHKLINKNVKCDFEMRLEAMLSISQLRNVIRDLAPAGSDRQRLVQSKLLPDQFKFVYWDEYAAAQYRKIDARKRAEASAIEWIGA